MGRLLAVAFVLFAAFAGGCSDDSQNRALSTRVAELQSDVGLLQTIAARPTPVPPTVAATPTAITAMVVQNTAAPETGCPAPQTQAVDWVVAGQRFSACFDPASTCVRLARIGGGLPAECGGVFPQP